jgi:hypothetical protein
MSLQYSNKLQIGAILPQVGATRRQAWIPLRHPSISPRHPRANLRQARATLHHPLLRALQSGESKSERYESVVAPEFSDIAVSVTVISTTIKTVMPGLYKDCHAGLDPVSIKAC